MEKSLQSKSGQPTDLAGKEPRLFATRQAALIMSAKGVKGGFEGQTSIWKTTGRMINDPLVNAPYCASTLLRYKCQLATFHYLFNYSGRAGS
ncbi:hypothetical protein [Vreelandella jeotgali]|uniref:hypothetical protein n=1 Tax=Vreelandella jeotgali TaxID=553386 RepID=UPI0012EA195C|nr:hypothetical protein [Halomonas jeotgali]